MGKLSHNLEKPLMSNAILSAKLMARANVFENRIKILCNETLYEARPLGWDEKGLIGMLQRSFTLRYFLYKCEKQISKMRYDDLHDNFLIEKQDNNINFKPNNFIYNGKRFIIKESLRTLKVLKIRQDKNSIVGSAKYGLSSFSIEFYNYPNELDNIIIEIAVLLIIRKMVWAMISPI